jgi:hypothetical protein
MTEETSKPKTNILATVSFVLGIASVIGYCITGIPAIIFGVLAVSKFKKSPNLKGKWMAYAGIGLGISLMVIWSVIGVILTTGADQKYNTLIEKGYAELKNNNYTKAENVFKEATKIKFYNKSLEKAENGLFIIVLLTNDQNEIDKRMLALCKNLADTEILNFQQSNTFPDRLVLEYPEAQKLFDNIFPRYCNSEFERRQEARKKAREKKEVEEAILKEAHEKKDITINSGDAEIVAWNVAETVYKIAKKYDSINKVVISLYISKGYGGGLIDKYGNYMTEDQYMGTITISDLVEVRKYKNSESYKYNDIIKATYMYQIKSLQYSYLLK